MSALLFFIIAAIGGLIVYFLFTKEVKKTVTPAEPKTLHEVFEIKLSGRVSGELCAVQLRGKWFPFYLDVMDADFAYIKFPLNYAPPLMINRNDTVLISYIETKDGLDVSLNWYTAGQSEPAQIQNTFKFDEFPFV
jgi:hypothetical protein